MSRRSSTDASPTMPIDRRGTSPDDAVTRVVPTVAGRPWTGLDDAWADRQAIVFAPPVGQRPVPGPDPTDRSRLLDRAHLDDRSDLIAERLEADAWSAGPAMARRTCPAAYMSAAAGLVLVAWSVVALARAGLGRPLGAPIVEVGGFTATAILGLIVLGAGAVLLLAAATRSRLVIGATGLLVSAAAVALAIAPTFDDSGLAAERDFAIAVAILAGITTLVAVFTADVVRVQREDRGDRWDHRREA